MINFQTFAYFCIDKKRGKNTTSPPNRNRLQGCNPKISHKIMKFKENHKIAVAKVLSDLVQCDGIVNQGEIDFLQQIYSVLRINATCRQKATTLSLSEAVNILTSLDQSEKKALLFAFQQLSVADDALDPTESLLITALLLSIDIDLTETQGLKAHFVSIPNLNFDTRNAVLYVEPEYDEYVNKAILADYESIHKLLKTSQREFFYLPKELSDLQGKRTTFRNTLNYIEPTLSDEQLDIIDQGLGQLDSVFFSKEIFLNYLNTNGLTITKPSFFFKIGNQKPGTHQDFLILEIGDSPLSTLKQLFSLNKRISKIKPKSLTVKERRFLETIAMKPNVAQKDELNYTGFHKIIIDTLLKYTASHEVSRLFINTRGEIFLTDRNNTEVKMPTLSKALYILILLEERGIPLTCLSDYKTRLFRIYRQISTYSDDLLLNQAIDNLTDFVGSTMNATLSRIKKAFTSILGDDATPYLLIGEKGGRRTIHLERKLVVFEDRKVFL